jgi:hypothetical protein
MRDEVTMEVDEVNAGRVAVVAIGRNEGERLRRCLVSVQAESAAVVYVDSGSADGSCEMARSLGVEVVELDMRRPFTAARARNEGFRRAIARHAGISYVQFIDGDCEMIAGWMGTARAYLDAHSQVAAVSGRLRERHPERSIYNRLCDAEWNTPVGQALACGGNAMFRVAALAEVDGFRDDLVAGEEPELCVRLRARRWTIWRIDAEMALHDAAMTRLGQWWRRTLRGGYAFAQGAALHGAPPERHGVRESRSAWLWGAAIPLLIVALLPVVGGAALFGLLVYPLQVARLYLKGSGAPRPRAERALFIVLGKFPEAAGQLKFLLHRWSRAQARLIEYK